MRLISPGPGASGALSGSGPSALLLSRLTHFGSAKITITHDGLHVVVLGDTAPQGELASPTSPQEVREAREARAAREAREASERGRERCPVSG
jgi:hypothetical protein